MSSKGKDNVFSPHKSGFNSQQEQMFKNLYKYWNTVNDNPFVVYKINLWSFVNLRFFKFKFTRNLTFFLLGLKSLKLIEIKLIYKDWIFEKLYSDNFKYFLILIIFIILI